MSRRRHQRSFAPGQKLLPGLLVLAGVGGMVALVSFGTVAPAPSRLPEKQPELETLRRREPAATGVVPRKQAVSATAAGPFTLFGKGLPGAAGFRRLPVSGAEGYTVVLNPDGTSDLEAPDGKKTPLVDSAFARVPSEKELEARIKKRLRRPAPGKRQALVGQLVVLDEGVVDVPTDALITYTGPDHLVALNANGTATVYWVDGRVEVRDRQRPVPASVPRRKLPNEK